MNIIVNARFGVKKTGIGRVIESLLNELSKIDTTNKYFIYTNEEFTNEFKFENQNFTIISNGVSANNIIKNHLWTQIGMYKAIKKHKADLLILPGITFFWRKKIPTVLFQHDLIEYYIPNQIWYKLLFRKLTFPITFRFVDKIVGVSQNTLNDLRNIFKIKESKLEVIYNGVDVSLFKKTDRNYANKVLAKKYNINSNFILYVGSITEPQKNLVKLVEAFSLLKKKGIKDKLVLVGNNGNNSHLVYDEINKLNLVNEVVHVGYVPDEDLKFFFSCAELFAFPSLYEGFGLPVLEAMACGCPCLTSNNSSLGEIAKGAAILIEPKCVKSIFSGMLKFYEEPEIKKQLIIDGLNRSKEYSWNKSGKQLLQLINSYK